MRRVLVLVVVLLAVTTTGLRLTGAAPSGTALAGASLTASATSLSGTQLAMMTVSLHLTDPTGVDTGPGDISDDDRLALCPCALLRVSPEVAADGGRGERVVELGRVSGSVTDGVWAGSVTVGAVERGTWSLVGVIAGTLRDPVANGPEWHAVDGASLGATIALTGSHWPVVAVAPVVPVAFASPYVVKGRLTYSDTGGGVPKAPVQVETPAFVGPFPRSVLMTRTDVDGNWSVVSRSAAEGVRALFDATDAELGPEQVYQWSAGVLRFGRTQHWIVSLTVRASGSWHYLDVSLVPRQQTSVQLQRLVNGSWSPVLTRTTASNGTFRFATQRHGCWRVRAMANVLMAPFTSRTVCF